MNNKKNKQSGFTIVELIVTIAIIGIAAASISSMFITIQRMQKLAALRDSATRAAQSEIEALRNNNYASLTPGQQINFTSSLPSSLPANKSGIAEISQPTDDLRRVDVTVSYTYSGKNYNVSLSSLIGVIGITQ